jgi:PAS domain-containing protein
VRNRPVGQKPVEMILMRQLASSLAMPIFLVDPAGNMLFYNEPAELILGRQYDDTGEMPFAEWSTIFDPRTDDGERIPPHALPLAIALEKRRAVYGTLWIRGLDGIARRIGVTAFPLEGQGQRHLGAVAIFWEEDRT